VNSKTDTKLKFWLQHMKNEGDNYDWRNPTFSKLKPKWKIMVNPCVNQVPTGLTKYVDLILIL